MKRKDKVKDLSFQIQQPGPALYHSRLNRHLWCWWVSQMLQSLSSSVAMSLVKAVGGGIGTWVHAIQAGDEDLAVGFWLFLGPVLSIVVICEVNLWMNDFFMSLLPFVALPFKLKDHRKRKEKENERERKVFSQVIHFLDGCHSQQESSWS